jgi:hypothetical protein
LDLAQLSSTPMPLEANGWSWNDGSSYEKLEANCRLRSGRILCRSLNIDMPRETVVGAGDVDLQKQTLNWNLSTAKLGAPARVPPLSGEPKLSIRGTLQQPSIRRTDAPTVGAGSLSTGATNKQATPH